VITSDYVELQPTWKANIRFLSANLLILVVRAARASRIEKILLVWGLLSGGVPIIFAALFWVRSPRC
jgi:uncharacterized membrane protein